jgi:hypothetical protein
VPWRWHWRCDSQQSAGDCYWRSFGPSSRWRFSNTQCTFFLRDQFHFIWRGRAAFVLDLKQQALKVLGCCVDVRPGRRGYVPFPKVNLHIALRPSFPWALVCLYGAIYVLLARWSRSNRQQ